MTNPINQVIKSVYIILIILPLFYLAISTYSYLSVVDTFGKAPINHNQTPHLEKSTGKSIKIFPVNIGGLICTLYIISLSGTPAFLAVVLISRYLSKSVTIFKGLAIILIGVNLLVFILWRKADFANWYMSYVLD